MTGVAHGGTGGREGGRGPRGRGTVSYKHVHLTFLSVWTRNDILMPSGAVETNFVLDRK